MTDKNQPTEPLPLQVPKKATLSKYGLSLEEWQEIAARQGYVCAVCKKLTKTGRLCIDHFHAPKWKKMPPEERKKYVRGILCFLCNTTFVGRGVTVDISKGVVAYLEAFELVRPTLPKK